MKQLFFTFMALALLASCSPQQSKTTIPQARKIEHLHIMHGDTRIDHYYWLRDLNNPEVVEYLKEENRFLEAKMQHTSALQEELFNEMTGRIKQDESSAPYYDNGFYYYSRFEEGGEYPIYCRRQGSMDAEEQIIINAPQLAEGQAYFRVSRFHVSPDNNWLAFTVDTIGRRQHTIFLKNLKTGEIQPTGIQYAAGDVVWAADNQTIFFTTIDPITLRYDNVRKLDTHSQNNPEIVYYEPDDTYYYMGVSQTKDRQYLMINCRSSVSNEIRILESNNPTGSFRVFQPRQKDLEYSVEHFQGKFYIRTNYNALNFRLMETPANRTNRANWRQVIGHRPDVLLENMEVFNDFIVLQERSNALQHIRIINQKTKQDHYIDFTEEAYAASININLEMDTDIFRFGYTSLTTPATIYDYNMNTRQQTQVWQQTVLGDFNPDHYHTRRFKVEARDGTEVPVTMVYNTSINLEQPNPVLQFGYGSYGSTMNPWFNSNILSLLDRGFIYVI
jgi:oligopeptidase B